MKARTSSWRLPPAASLAFVALVVVVVGCSGVHDQTMLAPSGPQATKITAQFWAAFWTAAAVYVVTVGFLVYALVRARRRERDSAPLPANPERRMTIGVSAAMAATLAILLVFLVYDFSVGRTLSPIPSARPITVDINGHQWWWEVHYPDSIAQKTVTTANEIHVPIGQPILFRLTASDVIHSFWVPNLAGKKDLIPGYTQTVWFQADTAGIYRGQCAEFCGMQHAKMALFVVAEPPAQFDAWMRAMRDSAHTPADTLAARGKEIFTTHSCVMCHSISGTTAASNAGPDLTHLASRRTIAAGTLPNSRGNLAGWILDPQTIKPGASMPPNQLSPAELNALLAYLQGLK